MDLNHIEAGLNHSDFQHRLRAIAALRDHPPDDAVPLLLRHAHDPEFLVRTFVARELGRQRNAESFATLLQLIRSDENANVRAEVANSLSLFGQVAAPQLVHVFFRDRHWLVRRSILAALIDMDRSEEVLEVCEVGVKGSDIPVQEASVDALGSLAASGHTSVALARLLHLKQSEMDYIRVRVAYALKHFDAPEAKAALAQLRQDTSHRVVGAAMEDWVP
ncbi:MAG: HEAT repeat domain-containing protein [Elainellaceae cyanobacterium]